MVNRRVNSEPGEGGVGSAQKKRSLSKRVKQEASQVRQILNEWDPIPGSPSDEYDCLVDRVVSALHRGAEYSNLTELINSELSDHFGIILPKEEIAAVSLRLAQWWSLRE